MTITKHTPVVVSDEARARLQRQIEGGKLDLRKPNPPRWVDQWLDLTGYRSGTIEERRELAAEAFEREYAHQFGREPVSAPAAHLQIMEAPAVTRTPARIADACTRVHPGTTYVPCSRGCGAFTRRHRPGVTHCGQCRPDRKPIVQPLKYQ